MSNQTPATSGGSGVGLPIESLTITSNGLDSNLTYNVNEHELPVGEGLPIEVSIVMPCLNEAETLATCIGKAQGSLRTNDIDGEVIIADNGSTDGSQEIARSMGARVVDVETKGYGSALMGGIAAARGKYLIMGDADDSYDFTNIMPFVEKLREGNDLVMGNRFKGGIKPGAMPPLHRFLGNPVLTGIGRLFFRSPCGDFHCGLRGFSKDAADAMHLQGTGMEFATEMVVKATLYKMRIAEVPTTLSPDGRSRPPHLRSWRDGWRNLRFLLLYSPRWLFLYPGVLLMVAGVLAMAFLIQGPITIGAVNFDIHTLLYAAVATILGFQAINFAVFSKIFAISQGLMPEDRNLNKLFRYITLETGLIVGSSLLVVGLAVSIIALNSWQAASFGPLNPSRIMRITIPGITCITLGVQIVLSSFFLSVLGMNHRVE